MRSIYLLPGALLAAALPCLARPGTVPQDTHAAAGDALVLEHAGLDALLSDPKDAGILAALQLVQTPLASGLELLGAPPPASELALFCVDLLRGPVCLRLGQPGESALGELPVYVQLEAEIPSREAAAALAMRFDQLLTDTAGMQSEPAADLPGLSVLSTPAGPLHHGVMERGGRALFVISMGAPVEREPDYGELDLVEGLVPAAAFRFDANRAQGLIDLLLAEMGPDGEELAMLLSVFGLYGEDALAIGATWGSDGSLSHGLVRYENWVSVAKRTGSLMPEPIKAPDLRLIPADATYAMMSQWNPGSILTTIELLQDIEGAEDDLVEQLYEETGFHLQLDLLDHLGNTMGLYMSDSTGGGGLFSTVAFVEVLDPELLSQSISKLWQLVDRGSGGMVGGVAQWRPLRLPDAGAEGSATLLSFPGLPVPLELSFAFHNGFLFMAATPQALEAAVAQTGGSWGDLRDNPRFAELVPSVEGLTALQFADTPRLLDDGYGLTSLVLSTVANLVRSHDPAQPDPGRMLPPFRSLAQGTHASVSLTRISGQDLLVRTISDPSAAVNLTGMMGSPIPLALAALVGIGAFAGVAAPMAAARVEQSYEMVAWADLYTVADAISMYAALNDGRYPDSLAVLLEPDEYGDQFIYDESLLFDPWGNPYVYHAPAEGETGFHLFSLGADGQPGGEGEDTDVHWTD